MHQSPSVSAMKWKVILLITPPPAMNILLVAEESAGLQVLRTLARSNHRLVAVMSAPPKLGNSAASVWTVAQAMGFETWPAKLVKDPPLAEQIRSRQVDILLNVHSLYIIRKEILSAPRYGAFNLHPGPLPSYAGLNVISWALYRGEKTHAVTIHKMEPEIDTGSVVYQSFFPISEEDNALSLSFKSVKEGVQLMVKLLDVASANPENIPLVPQDLSRREYFGRGVPQGGELRWSSPAHEIINFIRACDYFPFRSPWGHPRTQLGDQELAVVKGSRTGLFCEVAPGTVGRSTDSGMLVATADEWIMVRKLKVGDKYVNAAEILSRGDRLGYSV